MAFSGCVSTPSEDGEVPTIKLGHLPSDHDAPLHVATENPDLFKEKYGVYLKNVDGKNNYELYENDKKIANVESVLITQGGAQIMTLLSQGQLDMGINGVPPVVFSVDSGTKAKIVAGINEEGSAVVIRNDIPANNWDEFVAWVKAQNKAGKQVAIGHPLPVSIQYVMIKSALDYENITYTENADDKSAMVYLMNCKGQGSMSKLLEKGDLDAVIAWEPTPEILKINDIAKPIAYSAELPPEGAWVGHSCCVLVASDDAIANNRDVVKAMTKLMLAGNKEINKNPELAVNACSAQLGTPLEVEELSIPNIKFAEKVDKLKVFGPQFVQVMDEQGMMQNELKGLTEDEIREKLYDFSLFEEVSKEIDEIE
ncbi:ABC transporter substrate-binding protein [Methanococcus voltae]|uniref:NitT/TauT family transport system substrate-binding protein n=1 Tax=Methanococcus voltae TaxID=2188 RepID=A0A8J7UUC4_METVO|nr:ABC transporter substrate-binding protein [Methanococcus voltae]MBP2171879.1 NitT/TauT family transport system substrate-binding protein [Methanococcus voltae]MBP2201166.1 NitT/TauT family transport system substrate-binding protein [Methanococcus voltae]